MLMLVPRPVFHRDTLSRPKALSGDVLKGGFSMAAGTVSFLDLPPEVRELIYTELFRSLVFDSSEPQYGREDGGYDARLAILLANRQIHAEAGPLVLRHAAIHCHGAKDMLRLLKSLSPLQIRQLRYLRVECTLFCFKLPSAQTSFMTSEPYQFSVGALLGLFPGLQLDLVELYHATQGGEQDAGDSLGLNLINCLLKADGFREVRVVLRNPRDAFPGHWDETTLTPWRLIRNPADLASWKDLIRTQFLPRPGGSVDISIEEKADTNNDYWEKHVEAGFTLWGDLEVREAAHRDQPYDCGKFSWNFRARRGEGPCMVPEGGDGVLECVQMPPLRPKRAREVSDHLRWLVKENDWTWVDRMGYDE